MTALPTVRTVFLAASATLLVVAPGCSGDTSTATGAVLVSPERSGQLLSPDADRYDIRRVDPGFTRAVGDYSAQIVRLGATSPANARPHLRDALELLATAIEHIPGAPPERTTVAAARIRGDGDRISMAMPQGGPDDAAVVHALRVAAAEFLTLANGPYERAPLVLERARDFTRAANALGDPTRLRTDAGAIIEALDRAGMVLTAMHAAIAWGTVG